MTRFVRSAALAAFALPAFAAAQKPLALAKPDAEYAEPFTQITGVRELSNGRVLVADARDKTLQLIDLSAGTATAVGREGGGPGEYALPFRLVALPGDTSALYDVGNSRYLTILPDGKTGPDFRLESNAAARGDAVVGRGRSAAGGGRAGGRGRGGMTIATPRATDARGNIYYEGSSIAFGPEGELLPADSAPVLRFDRRAARTDTVAFVHVPKANVQVSGGGGNVRMVMGGANPLTPRDDWAVLPDGRVAVVRSPEYRLDVYGPSRAVKSGAPIAYAKIRVTDAVKKEVEDLRQKQTAGGIRMMVTDDGNGARRSVSVGGGGGGPKLELPPLADWPEFVPPFLANAAVSRPNGEVWVLRTREPGDDVPVYDVFDANGRVLGRVALPAKARLAGFGRNAVYVIRLDADDLQYLQRYRLPADIKLNG